MMTFSMLATILVAVAATSAMQASLEAREMRNSLIVGHVTVAVQRERPTTDHTDNTDKEDGEDNVGHRGSNETVASPARSTLIFYLVFLIRAIRVIRGPNSRLEESENGFPGAQGQRPALGVVHFVVEGDAERMENGRREI